jgi:endonuclease/exonuclease/phosphatase (EEP) superfamily protein YafD
MLQKTEEATYQYWIIQTQLRARHITKTNKQNLGKKEQYGPHQQPLKETLNYTNKPFAVEKFRVFS